MVGGYFITTTTGDLPAMGRPYGGGFVRRDS
jgi:hypothetical protein